MHSLNHAVIPRQKNSSSSFRVRRLAVAELRLMAKEGADKQVRHPPAGALIIRVTERDRHR